MSAAWTTDNLIERAKRKAQRPNNDLNYTDAEILQIADEEMFTFLAPLIRTTRESYYLKSYTVQSVVGQANYRIPSDTSAGTIRYCELIDNATNQTFPVAMVEPENRSRYLNVNVNWSSPLAVVMMGDQLEMLPSPGQASFSLRVWYEQRRSLLVPTSSCAQIASVVSPTSFNTGPTPAGWSAGMRVDFVESQPNFDIISLENQVTVVGAPLQVLNPVVAPKTVGAWICPFGYSCIVPLPDLFHFALVGCVASAMLEETSDLDTAQALRAEVASRIEGLSASVEPRAVGMAPVIYNPESPGRIGQRGGWWGMR